MDRVLGAALNLYYWRTRTGLEVDLVVYGTDFFAIEVKNKHTAEATLSQRSKAAGAKR